MSLCEIRRRIMILYNNIDKKINQDIEINGCVNLIDKGYRLGLIDVIMMFDGCVQDDWG